MKDAPISKQSDTDPGALSFSNLRTQFPEQRHDIRPLDIGRNRMGEDQFKSL